MPTTSRSAPSGPVSNSKHTVSVPFAASIGAQGTSRVSVAVEGARITDTVTVNPTGILPAGTFLSSAWVSAEDVVEVECANILTSAATVGTKTVAVTLHKFST